MTFGFDVSFAFCSLEGRYGKMSYLEEDLLPCSHGGCEARLRCLYAVVVIVGRLRASCLEFGRLSSSLEVWTLERQVLRSSR